MKKEKKNKLIKKLFFTWFNLKRKKGGGGKHLKNIQR